MIPAFLYAVSGVHPVTINPGQSSPCPGAASPGRGEEPENESEENGMKVQFMGYRNLDFTVNSEKVVSTPI